LDKIRILITGSGGFVGKNLIDYLIDKFSIIKHIRNNVINKDVTCFIHLAGKAHDLKNISSFDYYYEVNTEYTKKVFDEFIASNAKIFITLSSVKAVADKVENILLEEFIPNPLTHYGKSKLLAEEYILSKEIPDGKRVFILRPCMIHGPGNKGNLNLLYSFTSKGMPWPLGKFNNKRSFCSIDNICFVINELIQNEKIQSGIYNIADDEALSTNDIISLIAESQGKNSNIWNIPKFVINSLAKLGDLLRLPLNSERLNKLTETYIVSNKKIKNAIKKPLPMTAKHGLLKTFDSFNKMMSP
jgi:nucleoside-diphosphate-sugar epimerase